jgi:hypothetical protein
MKEIKITIKIKIKLGNRNPKKALQVAGCWLIVRLLRFTVAIA